MKKGLPKCVCAPNCKATASANKSPKVNSAKKIAVIQMPEKRNEKRLKPSEMQNDEPTLIVANINRRQGNKKLNQRAESKQKNDASEALAYSPLINTNLNYQIPGNMSNETDHHAHMIGSKIRSGFFNDHTVTVTSYVDAFYVGNLVSGRNSSIKRFHYCSFHLLLTATFRALQPNLWHGWQNLQERVPIEEASVSTGEQAARSGL